MLPVADCCAADETTSRHAKNNDPQIALQNLDANNVTSIVAQHARTASGIYWG
jgi:hypothetical protein